MKGRVSDRTLVRTACGTTRALAHSPIGALEWQREDQMQHKKKTTALRPQSRRKRPSTKQPSGLIAPGKKLTQSAGTKSALYNRSHRTTDRSRSVRFFVSGLSACQWYQRSLIISDFAS